MSIPTEVMVIGIVLFIAVEDENAAASCAQRLQVEIAGWDIASFGLQLSVRLAETVSTESADKIKRAWFTWNETVLFFQPLKCKNSLKNLYKIRYLSLYLRKPNWSATTDVFDKSLLGLQWGPQLLKEPSMIVFSPTHSIHGLHNLEKMKSQNCLGSPSRNSTHILWFSRSYTKVSYKIDELAFTSIDASFLQLKDEKIDMDRLEA